MSALSVAYWVAAALAVIAVWAHIRHDLKGGHRR